MALSVLSDDPPKGTPTVARLLLAHGAGAPMDSPWMTEMARLLAEHGIAVRRFEFGYMAARRTGSRKPPPRAETLLPEFRTAVHAVAAQARHEPLMIGGKSMGGRVASLAAEALFANGAIAGLICLGYPLHPPGKPEALRFEHMARLTVPALIVQGERDPFGTREEFAAQTWPPAVTLHWAPGGDHDLKPRRADGTLAANMAGAASAIAGFARPLSQPNHGA